MSPIEIDDKRENEMTSIHVPTILPTILKQFCKAAIRTQPYDLLKWSRAYFRALAEGEEPPAKIRLEYPIRATKSGLTFGYLKVLLRQLGDYNNTLPLDLIYYRWDCLCLDREELDFIVFIGKFHNECQVKKLLAIAASLMTENLFETMILICELFTSEPDGASAMIPITLFMEIYGYLAGMKCDGDEKSLVDDTISAESKTKTDKNLSSVRSHTSQNTDADIVSEFESIPIDESEVVMQSEKLSFEDVDGREKAENESKENSIDRKKKMYPNVPGIGPRLSATRVATVAVWLTDCARRQNGMVGPRNLRHLLCPPL